ncbi:urea amidolyase associated protein UAAP1 [Saccharibacillus brassicae]|uniref:DUF1989 domain-containing protein n=1 Tax=Saccharibacillus brassicae TaxID=2583377 RepID=A0A4Y6UUQ4_SACBS|nr:urea amidolyase associated protein UAAP1 [Saccharibacillus brassicae]QDH21432.1 DUF1989 domain-containing protein [Saccharibacillus brassicae]
MEAFTIQPGGKWSGIIGKGKRVRFEAAGRQANLSALLYSAADSAERYNMPDTLKAQHTAFFTAGHVLMSDQGRVLASIVEDTAGWHDPLGGYTTRSATDDRYGFTRYQQQRNDWLRSGAENFTVELFRSRLTARDLIPPVNLFSKVVCELDGSMRYAEQDTEGRSVTLRTEMDVLFVFSNTPNPLNPSPLYPDAAIAIEVSEAAPVTDQDLCVRHCPENRRAFENTWQAQALLRGANVQ